MSETFLFGPSGSARSRSRIPPGKGTSHQPEASLAWCLGNRHCEACRPLRSSPEKTTSMRSTPLRQRKAAPCSRSGLAGTAPPGSKSSGMYAVGSVREPGRSCRLRRKEAGFRAPGEKSRPAHADAAMRWSEASASRRYRGTKETKGVSSLAPVRLECDVALVAVEDPAVRQRFGNVLPRLHGWRSCGSAMRDPRPRLTQRRPPRHASPNPSAPRSTASS